MPLTLIAEPAHRGAVPRAVAAPVVAGAFAVPEVFDVATVVGVVADGRLVGVSGTVVELRPAGFAGVVACARLVGVFGDSAEAPSCAVARVGRVSASVPRG